MADENVSKDEQVGFHKGALSTLAKERQELIGFIAGQVLSNPGPATDNLLINR